MSKIKYVVLAVIFFVLGFVLYRQFVGPVLKKSAKIAPAPVEVVIPTKTPEEIKIISQIKTNDVLIYTDGAKPKVLGIKLHDQVRFVNKTSKSITVSGDTWEGILLAPEENMTVGFDEAGNFSYKVAEFTPEVSGQIFVE